MNEQISIFDYLNSALDIVPDQRFKITKPIRLIELFGG